MNHATNMHPTCTRSCKSPIPSKKTWNPQHSCFAMKRSIIFQSILFLPFSKAIFAFVGCIFYLYILLICFPSILILWTHRFPSPSKFGFHIESWMIGNSILLAIFPMFLSCQQRHKPSRPPKAKQRKYLKKVSKLTKEYQRKMRWLQTIGRLINIHINPFNHPHPRHPLLPISRAIARVQPSIPASKLELEWQVCPPTKTRYTSHEILLLVKNYIRFFWSWLVCLIAIPTAMGSMSSPM